jgi:hypothetical protein
LVLTKPSRNVATRAKPEPVLAYNVHQVKILNAKNVFQEKRILIVILLKNLVNSVQHVETTLILFFTHATKHKTQYVCVRTGHIMTLSQTNVNIASCVILEEVL